LRRSWLDFEMMLLVCMQQFMRYFSIHELYVFNIMGMIDDN
jgi:hypothetical protein